ncbi:hypothetical protein HPB50_010703 [Hyalomma asiaticum]|uniref:Uncharacterized protein n=1 Tax=Hyalomma asiaticum TaxID=266040 RepID=A0ACB7SFS6_HYAAI|nr:hypothetical protein HPB50_010703 [Hyalomma asiaticum]
MRAAVQRSGPRHETKAEPLAIASYPRRQHTHGGARNCFPRSRRQNNGLPRAPSGSLGSGASRVQKACSTTGHAIQRKPVNQGWKMTLHKRGGLLFCGGPFLSRRSEEPGRNPPSKTVRLVLSGVASHRDGINNARGLVCLFTAAQMRFANDASPEQAVSVAADRCPAPRSIHCIRGEWHALYELKKKGTRRPRRAHATATASTPGTDDFVIEVLPASPSPEKTVAEGLPSSLFEANLQDALTVQLRFHMDTEESMPFALKKPVGAVTAGTPSPKAAVVGSYQARVMKRRYSSGH